MEINKKYYKDYGFLYPSDGIKWQNTVYEQTPKNLAALILKRAMKIEGKKFNKENRIVFLKEWAEHYEEISDDGQKFDYRHIADSVADHYIFCNSLHIIKRSNRTEIDNQLRNEIYIELVRLLENDLK